MQAVLDHYGVQLRKVNDTTLRGKCPLPVHTSKESKESFTVSLSKGCGGAWACQSASCVSGRRGRRGGNVLDFVAVMENCSVREAAIRLAEWFGIRSPAPGATPKEPGKPDSLRQAPEQGKHQLVAEKDESASSDVKTGESESGEVNQPLKFQLKGIDSNHAYLMKRGIKQETAEVFGVGFFPGKGSMFGRVVIPINNQAGALVAYAGRSIDGSEPKYKLPAGFKKSVELFNLHRALQSGGKRVIVVEGFFDCMKVHQAGFPCTVALMGSTLSEKQEELLVENFDRVVVTLDGDEAGKQGTAEILPRLARKVFTRIVEVPSGRQPDQLSSEGIRGLLACFAEG